MNRFVRILMAVIFLAVPAWAQNQIVQGFCDGGASTVSIPGTQGSSSTFQSVTKSCTVTVYNHGTVTLSTVYSDAGGTAKANPFTASATGYWFFYASGATTYDVALSTGITLTNIPVEPTVNIANFISAGDFAQQVAAAALTIPNGGIIDATGLGWSTQTITSGPVIVGSATQPILLKVNPLTTFVYNKNSGATVCGVQVFNASGIVSEGLGQMLGGSGALWELGASANVKALICPGQLDGTQEYLYLKGLMLEGNATATVAKGVLYLSAIGVNSKIEDVNWQACYGTCAYIEGSSGGGGISDLTFINDNFDASHTGSSPVVVLQGPGVDGLTFHGGAMQHASDGQNILKIDQVGGAGFYGVHFETYGSAPGNAGDAIAISDSSNLIFSGVKTSGASGTNFFSISHGAHTTPANIIIQGMENPGAWTNLVNNSVSSQNCASNSKLCGSQSLVGYYYNGAVVNDAITTTGLSARMIWPAYVSGAFSTNSSYAEFTPDVAITVTAIELTWIQNSGTCTGAPTIQLLNAGPTNTITFTWNGSVHQIAAFNQNYPAGTAIVMKTDAGTCSVPPDSANVYVQYKMQ